MVLEGSGRGSWLVKLSISSTTSSAQFSSPSRHEFSDFDVAKGQDS